MKTQKTKLRHFRQQETRHPSSYLVSKLNKLASSLIANRNPLKSEAKTTVPVWNLASLQMESPQGEPAYPLTLLKYQTETDEHIMKWLHPWKKKIAQRPTNRKITTAAIYPGLRAILGKAELLGKEKSPFE